MSVFGQLIGAEMRPENRAPRVARTSEDGNERIVMYPDTSMNARAALHNATQIYGRQNLSPEFAMRAVIEVKGPDGEFVPVTGSRQGVPSMEVQQAALASFRETGIIGPQSINPEGSAANSGDPVIAEQGSDPNTGASAYSYEGVVDATPVRPATPAGMTPLETADGISLNAMDSGYARPAPRIADTPIIQRQPGNPIDDGGLMPQRASEEPNVITPQNAPNTPASVVDATPIANPAVTPQTYGVDQNFQRRPGQRKTVADLIADSQARYPSPAPTSTY